MHKFLNHESRIERINTPLQFVTSSNIAPVVIVNDITNNILPMEKMIQQCAFLDFSGSFGFFFVK